MRIYECKKDGDLIYVVIGNRNFKRFITFSCHDFLANVLMHHYFDDFSDNELYNYEKKHLKINKYI